MVVRECSKELNHPEVIWNLKLTCTPGSPTCGGTRRFERVEPHRTHVILPCTPGSLSQMVVRECSKGLNHPEVIWNLKLTCTPGSPTCGGTRRFERVDPHRTHVILPCTPGSLSQMVVRECSKGLNHPEVIWNLKLTCTPGSPTCGGTRRFERVEPHRTHVILPCTPGSLSQMVVRECSKGLNHPEVIWNLKLTCTPGSPTCGGTRRFERVEPHRTHVILPCTPGSLSQMVVRECSKELNHPEVIWNLKLTCTPGSPTCGGKRRFERVDPHRTHVIPPCTPGSLSQMVVRECLKGLNHPEVIWNQPELMSNYSEHQVTPVKPWFEQVRSC